MRNAHVHGAMRTPHSVGGDELGNREVTDDDDADTAQNERRVEHTGSKSGTVTQLREIVIEPIGVVGGETCSADA